MRIVLIEDNQMLAEGIQKILLDEGHSVDYFVDGERADQHLRYEGADLAIIDINLPNMDGISITKNIRARKQLFPIIILTARGATKDRVIGLDAGADDYLVKPFQMDELDARIRALSRRNTSLLSNTESIGSLAYNRTSRRLYFNDNELTLNRRELTLFEILINKKGQYISKSSTDEIMRISVVNKKPVGNGIITCLNMQQAIVRKKKGREAAQAVLSVISQ